MTDDFDPMEKLAIMSPKAIDISHIPGGIPRITQQDIAAILAGVSAQASAYARATLEHHNARKQLFYHLKDEYKVISGGEVDKHLRCYTMAAIAIQEILDSKLCNLCKGHSFVPEVDHELNEPTGRVVECWNCNGTGRTPFTNNRRARLAGVHHEEWKKKWDSDYTKGLTVLYTWAGEVREALKKG